MQLAGLPTVAHFITPLTSDILARELEHVSSCRSGFLSRAAITSLNYLLVVTIQRHIKCREEQQ